jgi:hypothetical protein
MKKNLCAMLVAGAIATGVAAPALADGPLSSGASLLGSSTAVVIDTPEGLLYHSLWNCPKATSHYLAEAFGDENGFGQVAVGLLLGVPTGAIWGVPYGAIMGAKHGWTTGWEKPFSMESFNVTEES